VEPGEWYRLAITQRHPDADAYFLSCTTIRAAPVIDALERDLGKPVVTSNQAVAWHSLRIGGVRDQTTGFGALLRLH
jgi:maleate isomerase